jgi:hypothetical protein
MPTPIAEKSAQRDRWIAVYIGALSVVLAICALGGENAAKEASSKNIEAANTWAWFQAKNMRRDALRLQTAELELFLATQLNLDEATRKAFTDRISAYRQQEALLTTEPETGEGLNELFAKAKALEAERISRASRTHSSTTGKPFCKLPLCSHPSPLFQAEASH